MNDFQQICRDRLVAALALRGLEPVFERLPGDPNPFGTTEDRSGHYRAEIRAGGRRVEVYLYLEDAGFRTERNWHVFESFRFDSAHALATAMTRELESWLDA